MRFVKVNVLVGLIGLACAGVDSTPVPIPEDPTVPDPEPPDRQPDRRKGGKGKAVRAACDVAAWVSDPDPAGLNVRREPSGSAAVVGKLPTEDPVIVTLSDARGGWLRLSSARWFDQDRSSELPQDGWVHGSLLKTGTRNYGPTSEYRLHERPERGSPVVVDPGEASVTLVGCDGAWVQVRFEGDTGWLEPEGQCPNPATNCS